MELRSENSWNEPWRWRNRTAFAEKSRRWCYNRLRSMLRTPVSLFGLRSTNLFLRRFVDRLDVLLLLVGHREALAILKRLGIGDELDLPVLGLDELPKALEINAKEFFSRVDLIDA